MSIWGPIRGPTRLWDVDTLGQIMRACIMMHNMIVEDERDDGKYFNYDDVGKDENTPQQRTFTRSIHSKLRTLRTRKTTHNFNPTLLSTCDKNFQIYTRILLLNYFFY